MRFARHRRATLGLPRPPQSWSDQASPSARARSTPRRRLVPARQECRSRLRIVSFDRPHSSRRDPSNRSRSYDTRPAPGRSRARAWTLTRLFCVQRISQKAASFTESVIREMNRLAVDAGAIGLAQGFPDFSCPPELKEAAAAAVHGDVNQYAITWGARPLRRAIAAKTARFYPSWDPDPETEITVTCGATEGMIAAMLGLLDPGDEVIVFEPFYENYGPDAILTGATPRYVALRPPDWSFDPDALRNVLSIRTRAIVVNSPHNPTGKVFTREELETIASIAREHDLLVFTDDIYEHLVYDGRHIPMATLPGMRERTVAVNSVSKTYSVTGWRVGWVIAPPTLSVGVRK